MAEPEHSEQKSSLFVVLSVVFIFAVMTVYVLDRYVGFNVITMITGPARSVGGEAEGSLQAAVDTCKQEVSFQLGTGLLSSRMDSLSTRYDTNRQQYLVILDITIRGKERIPYYFECTVSAVTQQIDRTRVTGPPGSFDQIGI